MFSFIIVWAAWQPLYISGKVGELYVYFSLVGMMREEAERMLLIAATECESKGEVMTAL